jgi:hypothetical protein
MIAFSLWSFLERVGYYFDPDHISGDALSGVEVIAIVLLLAWIAIVSAYYRRKHSRPSVSRDTRLPSPAESRDATPMR